MGLHVLYNIFFLFLFPLYFHFISTLFSYAYPQRCELEGPVSLYTGDDLTDFGIMIFLTLGFSCTNISLLAAF